MPLVFEQLNFLKLKTSNTHNCIRSHNKSQSNARFHFMKNLHSKSFSSCFLIVWLFLSHYHTLVSFTVCLSFWNGSSVSWALCPSRQVFSMLHFQLSRNVPLSLPLWEICLYWDWYRNIAVKQSLSLLFWRQLTASLLLQAIMVLQWENNRSIGRGVALQETLYHGFDKRWHFEWAK